MVLTKCPFQPVNNGKHPHEKPIKLMKYLFRYIPKDKIVLEPFAGIGTTLVAGKSLNRKCIGIEIEEKYCEIAAKRCCQSVMRLDV